MQTQSFQKIMRELEKRIHTGIYTPESALPSRTELIAEFKVARATVERAIRELIRSGVLISRQGSGTSSLLISKKNTGSPRSAEEISFMNLPIYST